MIYIDIGNTCINIYQHQEKIYHCIKTTDFLNEEAEILLPLASKVYISSVVPQASKKIERLCKAHNLDVYFLTHRQDIIKINTKNPHEVGPDLISAAIGSTKYSNDCVIIDLGTATKLIRVRNKQLCGVIITSGIETSLRGLIKNAALLKDFQLKKPSSLFGTDTDSALNSGFITGHIAMIEGFIKRIKAEDSHLDIFLTGGLAHFIADDIAHPHYENLVIEGLQVLGEKLCV